MSNQSIIVSVLADTKQLKSGLQNVESQLGGFGTSVSKVTGLVKAMATAFILSQVQDLFRNAINEAEDAAKAMAGANTVFGATPGLLNDIAAKADAVGLALGKDNDDILKLATNIGARLSPAAKGLSVDLVATGADIAALTGVDLETWSKKFSKQMVDGALSTKEMAASFPGLTDATYKQAEAMFKAGNDAGALNVLIAESAKVNGNAAEDQVTATQKLDTIMASLSETVGQKLLPVVEGFAVWLEDSIAWAKDNKEALLGWGAALLGAAGGLTAVTVAMKAYAAFQKIQQAITAAGTVAQWAMNVAMSANPIGILIVAIAALVAGLVYFFTQTEAGKKAWENFSKFLGDTWNNIVGFVKKGIAFILDIFTKFHPLGILIKNWNGIMTFFGSMPAKFISFGKNMIDGLLNGLKSGIKAVTDFVMSVGNSIMGGIKKIFGIKSPSREMKKLGQMINAGLAVGLDDVTKIDKAVLGVSDSLSFDATANYNSRGSSNTPGIASQTGNTYNITVQAVAPNAEVGRAVAASIAEYERISGRRTL